MCLLAQDADGLVLTRHSLVDLFGGQSGNDANADNSHNTLTIVEGTHSFAKWAGSCYGLAGDEVANFVCPLMFPRQRVRIRANKRIV
jgi:hypothetical protein